MELKYINQINKNFGSSASKCTILDNSLRAFDLYSSFDIMLFDSLGTGFFECISAGNAAFLLPSADWTPHRDAVEPVSENFFVSRTSINSLDQAKAVFAKASYESKSFMSTYGKPTDVDIVDFLITLQE